MSVNRGPGWEAFVRDLGQELGRRRVAAGLSQEALAAEAGITRNQYQRLEKGEVSPGHPANPTLATMLAVSQALGVPLAELLPNDVPRMRDLQ